jgi:hypothetical protein
MIMLVKMVKKSRVIDVNCSPQSIDALKKFGWELAEEKTNKPKKTKKK